jgi:hypothetical protein
VTRLILLCAIVITALPAQSPRALSRTFDADRAGLPDGLTFAAMRQPTPGAWTIRREGSNGVLVHAAESAATGYALAIAPDGPFLNLSAGVRLRLAGGARAGGLVWQYQDEHNHYAAVLDLSRQELSMYRVVAGNRTRLELEDDLELDPEAWHTMKVVHDDDEITVSLGGIKVFEEHGRSTRVAAPHRCGLIAAGNSEVWFDDWRVEARQGRR